MTFINYAAREINCKIVYYGPGLCGKTTNLQWIYDKTNPQAKGKLISLATETDRTLFFDFLPLDLGTVRGFKTRFHLYTVPGQVFYDASRKLILKGVDGVVFVADSQDARMEANIESMANLDKNLKEQGYDLKSVPYVLQFNKRDLPTALPADEMYRQLNFKGEPTFEAVLAYAKVTKADPVKVPLTADYRHDLARMAAACTSKTGLVYVCNPNNPTGAAALEEELMHVARSAPQAAVLIDEAYVEFHGQTLLGKWRELPNLFVARTFSKAYGLAGLRAGVLMGDAQQISGVRKVASPYNINSIALACLPDALQDQAYVGRYVKEVCEGRERLQRELQNLGIPFWPSRANFVLMRIGEANTAFVRAMRQLPNPIIEIASLLSRTS